MAENAPQAIFVAGSETDKPIIVESGMLSIADEIGYSWELSFASAHRHPKDLSDYCKTQARNGALVFTGFAALSAALPGAIAAATEGKSIVLGVPLIASDGIKKGEDALFSMIRMPPYMPVSVPGMHLLGLKLVAVVIGQIIALVDPKVREGLEVFLAGKQKPAKFGAMKSPLK